MRELVNAGLAYTCARHTFPWPLPNSSADLVDAAFLRQLLGVWRMFLLGAVPLVSAALRGALVADGDGNDDGDDLERGKCVALSEFVAAVLVPCLPRLQSTMNLQSSEDDANL